MTKCKILLIGATGNVGSILTQIDRLSGHTSFIPCSRSGSLDSYKLDPFNTEDLCRLINRSRPTHILLLSALSKPSDCHSNPNLSYRLNVLLPHLIATIAFQFNLGLIYPSTEYIYNGELSGSKNENWININPSNIYSQHKLISESVVLCANPNTSILRLPKMYSRLSTKCFLGHIISYLNNKPHSVPVASDQYFSPLSIECLYTIVLKIASMRITGVFNCGGPDISFSRFEFYSRALRCMNILTPIFYPVSFSYFDSSVTIPRDTRMDSSILYNSIDYQPQPFLQYLSF